MSLRRQINNESAVRQMSPSIASLVERYYEEKMPGRYSTSRGYRSWFNNHILPTWGTLQIADVRPRNGLDCSLRPRARCISALCFPRSSSMRCGRTSFRWIAIRWTLVTVKNASRRSHKPRSLTAQEFHCLLGCLTEPYRTMSPETGYSRRLTSLASCRAVTPAFMKSCARPPRRPGSGTFRPTVSTIATALGSTNSGHHSVCSNVRCGTLISGSLCSVT